MARYNEKIENSFQTKLKLFLFVKAFDENILNYIKNNKEIQKDFEQFQSTADVAKVYSSQYYQFSEDEEIILNDRKKLLSKDLLSHLMDKSNYIISTKNLKNYLKDLYDELKKDYSQDSNVIQFSDFKELLENTSCTYCGISLKQIAKLGRAGKLNNKRSETRGYTLEIDRISPNLEYTKDNCCMSCYWCNNAKTDEFSASEFKTIAKGINETWNKRLQEIESSEIVPFQEDAEIWKKDAN